MKAFIFDPLWSKLVTTDQLAKFDGAGVELIVIEEIAPLDMCESLFTGNEPRVLCINPDYVGWKLVADDYNKIPNLKAILVESTSFGWLDMDYATQNEVPVCNIRGFSAQAVAEWAVMTALNLVRQMPRLIKDGFPLDFDKDYMKYQGIELQGKTAGIIGLGRNGSLIAERCRGLGMNVTYWSKNSRSEAYTLVELEKLFSESDVIFPTVAHNDETKQLITDQLLTSMKPSAILVDTIDGDFSRELVLDMIKNNKLYGYGFEAEPKSFGTYEGNVWAAPAYAWDTDTSLKTSVELLIDNILAANQQQFPNQVN